MKENKVKAFFDEVMLLKNQKMLFSLFLKQLRHSYVFYILLALMCIAQPVILSVLLCINQGMNSSIYLIIIPSILYMVFILYASYKLLSENRYNYIDTDLIAKSFTRNTILCCKISIIFFFVLISLLIDFAYAVIFCLASSNSSFILPIFISNILISPFLYLIFQAIVALISLYLKPIFFTVISSIILFFASVPSLFTRPLLGNSEANGTIVYQNENYEVAKLCSKDATYFGVKIVNNNWSYNDVVNRINDNYVANNFIPSEWTLSFYNSAFKLSGVDNMSGNNLNANDSILNYNLQPVDFNKVNNNIVVRGQDINPLQLDANELVDLVLKNIDQIASSANNINLKDKDMAKMLQTDLQNKVLWDETTLLNDKELSTIRDLTGINTEHNILFYVIKYSDELSYLFKPLETAMLKQYSQEMFDLFTFVCNSKQTNTNLFAGNNNVLGTGHPISYFYPTCAIVDKDKPITTKNANFIKNTLITFTSNTTSPSAPKDVVWQPYYLNSVGNYIAIDSLDKIDPIIRDKASWEKYVDLQSLKYSTTKELLTKLKQAFPDIYQFNLEKNAISEFAFDYYFSVEPATYLWFAPIFISVISLGSVPLFIALISLNKKSSYKDL